MLYFGLTNVFSCSSGNKKDREAFNEKNKGITREVGLSDFQPYKPLSFENTGWKS